MPRGDKVLLQNTGRATRKWRALESRLLQKTTLTAVVAALLLCRASTSAAETFSYEGSALIDCICPQSSDSNDCSTSDLTDFEYSVMIFVKENLTIDLNDKCFRARDTTQCCEEPLSRFQGSVGQECSGSNHCP